MKKRYEAQIQELHNDIRLLVCDDKSLESTAVKFRWRLQFDFGDIVWGEHKGGFSGKRLNGFCDGNVTAKPKTGILACQTECDDKPFV